MSKEKIIMSSRNYFLIITFLVFTSFFSYAQNKNESKSEYLEVTEVVIDTVITEKSETKPVQKKYYEVPFFIVEQPPYPLECDSFKTKSKRQQCTKEFIKKYVLDRINTNLIKELGLFAEDERISFLFKINVNGKVIDIKCAAPHPDLEKEGIRVIKLLPDFTPGIQRRHKVIVPFSFSINISEIVSNVNDDD